MKTKIITQIVLVVGLFFLTSAVSAQKAGPSISSYGPVINGQMEVQISYNTNASLPITVTWYCDDPGNGITIAGPYTYDINTYYTSLNITGLVDGVGYEIWISSQNIWGDSTKAFGFIANDVTGTKNLSATKCTIEKPQNGALKIHAAADMVDNATIQVFNLLGQKEIEKTLTQQDQAVETFSLITGYYIVAVKQKDVQITKRVFVE